MELLKRKTRRTPRVEGAKGDEGLRQVQAAAIRLQQITGGAFQGIELADRRPPVVKLAKRDDPNAQGKEKRQRRFI